MRVMSVIPRTDPSLACWWRMDSVASALESYGHKIDFVHYGGREHAKWPGSQKSAGSHTYVVAPRPVIPFKHLRAVSNGSYQLVFANMQTAAIHSCLSRIADVPLVVDFHGDIVAEFRIQSRPPRYSARVLLEYSRWKLADLLSRYASTKIVCVSNKMMEVLGSQGVRRSKLIFAPNGVDLAFYNPTRAFDRKKIRESLGMSQSLVFGYLGGDARWQGVDMLLDAANRLKDDSCDFLFVGLSTGAKSVGRLHVLPPVPREDTPSYYSACDVLVLPRPKHPATEVASPTKFAEYAAMGKPILTTNVGDPAALVRKYSCGIVVQNDTSDALLQGLQEMLAKPKSDLEQMGRQARLLAEKEFDWRFIGARLNVALGEITST